MLKNRRAHSVLALLVVLVAAIPVAARALPSSPPPSPATGVGEFPPADPIIALIEQLQARGVIVGGQIVVARNGKVLASRNVGVISPDRQVAVNDRTLFCIGSVSKPVFATLALGLVEEGLLDLETPIDGWLPEFASPVLLDGTAASRAATLREVLMHRAGFFSQFSPLTGTQVDLLYNFSRPLDRAVNGIASERLRSEPGAAFAYSGAGYLVGGRLAEVAADDDLDTLLRARITEPLGMERTSFFPSVDDDNVSAGAVPGTVGTAINTFTPHLLGKKHRLAFVGGGIYSTAAELTRFGHAIARRGRIPGGGRLLRNATWKRMTDGAGLVMPAGWAPYGMGWQLRLKDGGTRPRWLYHSGQIASNITYFGVDPRRGYTVAIVVSTAEWSNGGASLGAAFTNLMGQLTAS